MEINNKSTNARIESLRPGTLSSTPLEATYSVTRMRMMKRMRMMMMLLLLLLLIMTMTMMRRRNYKTHLSLMLRLPSDPSQDRRSSGGSQAVWTSTLGEYVH
jgi:hypothetical protein